MSQEVDTTSSNLPTEFGLPADDGLGDMDETDVSAPIYRASADEGGWIDPLTQETYQEFNAILLGVHKQRVLWPPEMQGEGEGPICRSYDHDHGVPDLAKFIAKYDGVTPQEKSGFSLEQIQAASDLMDDALICADCHLSEWDSHPRNKSPWCAEQFAIPFIRLTDDGGEFPGILMFQRTSLKSVRAYLNSFKAAKRPAYTAVTRVRAVMNTKGAVKWITPSFTRVRESEPTEWASYSLAYRAVKDFLGARREEATEETGLTAEHETPVPPPTRVTKPETVIETTASEADATPKPPKRAQPDTTTAPASTPEPEAAEPEDDELF